MKRNLYLIAFAFFSLILIQAQYCNKHSNSACDCEASNTISKNVTLNQSNATSTLSVYSETGDYTADPACHANMILTYRWADDERAKTSEKPPIGFEFVTVLGYFPTSPSSAVMNTDEFGRNYWKVVVNEADNTDMPTKGISYGIELIYDKDYPNHGDVKCSSSITYKIFSASQWEDGCG